MKRTRYLILSACSTLLALAALCNAARPNVIIIMSDDMGFSDIGCYGSEIGTPTLDGLAANGVRFTQFYNTGRCCPTRASLLSGLYPHQAGIGHMMSDRGLEGYRGNLNRSCVTIAEAVKPAGYATYMAGKWHVTPLKNRGGEEQDKSNWPLQRGFDRFYGTIHGAGSFFDPNTLTRDNKFIAPDADPEYKPETFFYTDAISDHAARFIKEHDASKPFFMYVAYTAAHWPMHALPKDIAKYKGKYDKGYGAIRAARLKRARAMGLVDPKWQMAPQADDWEKAEPKPWELRCMEVYAAMVDNMDQGIAKIVGALKDKDVFENTLILFLQDNGGCAEGLGRGGNKARADKPTRPPMPVGTLQHDMIPKQTRDGYPVLKGKAVMPGPADTYIAYGRGWANVSNTPFREYKHWVHEGGIATPLIAHWPAGIARKNALESQPAHLVDLMATCVDLAGADYPKERAGHAIAPMEGVSLAPAFNAKDVGRKNPIYWEHEGNRAIRDGKWKLVARGGRGAWELYDMEADRTELNDLAEEEPERVEAMAANWEAWARRAHAIPWIWGGLYGGNDNSKGSKKTRFVLKKGDALPRDKAPRVHGRGFTVKAELTAGKDGVIVAQGGTAHGFTVYVKEGRLTMAARHASKLTTIAADAPLPAGKTAVEMELTRKGKVVLRANGKTVAEGAVPGALKAMPADGLEVGRDDTAPVGEYKVPFAFGGEIRKVTIELGK